MGKQECLRVYTGLSPFDKVPSPFDEDLEYKVVGYLQNEKDLNDFNEALEAAQPDPGLYGRLGDEEVQAMEYPCLVTGIWHDDRLCWAPVCVDQEILRQLGVLPTLADNSTYEMFLRLHRNHIGEDGEPLFPGVAMLLDELDMVRLERAEAQGALDVSRTVRHRLRRELDAARAEVRELRLECDAAIEERDAVLEELRAGGGR